MISFLPIISSCRLQPVKSLNAFYNLTISWLEYDLNCIILNNVLLFRRYFVENIIDALLYLSNA